jgi:large subunit ribosomal protein L16
MLAPKRIKHRKQHRGRRRGLAKGHTDIQSGDYAIVAMEPGWITNRQIEAARVAITRHIRRGGNPSRRSRRRPGWDPGRGTPRAGWPS